MRRRRRDDDDQRGRGRGEGGGVGAPPEEGDLLVSGDDGPTPAPPPPWPADEEMREARNASARAECFMVCFWGERERVLCVFSLVVVAMQTSCAFVSKKYFWILLMLCVVCGIEIVQSVSRGDFFRAQKHTFPARKKVPFPVLMCKISGWLAHQKNTVSSGRKRVILTNIGW